jgi:hypothetical protein
MVQVEGERVIDAPRERVFDALTDADVVASSIPVIRSHREVDDDHWEAKIKPPLPFAPSVTIRFEVTERRPPEHAAIRTHGGGADVISSFDLETDGDGRTRIRWRAQIALHGILAAFGGHGLEPVARRVADHTLDAIARRAQEP